MGPEPWLGSAATERLRAQLRCSMCHKRCWVPCRYTRTQFELLADEAEAAARGAGEDQRA